VNILSVLDAAVAGLRRLPLPLPSSASAAELLAIRLADSTSRSGSRSRRRAERWRRRGEDQKFLSAPLCDAFISGGICPIAGAVTLPVFVKPLQRRRHISKRRQLTPARLQLAASGNAVAFATARHLCTYARDARLGVEDIDSVINFSR